MGDVHVHVPGSPKKGIKIESFDAMDRRTARELAAEEDHKVHICHCYYTCYYTYCCSAITALLSLLCYHCSAVTALLSLLCCHCSAVAWSLPRQSTFDSSLLFSHFLIQLPPSAGPGPAKD